LLVLKKAGPHLGSRVAHVSGAAYTDYTDQLFTSGKQTSISRANGSPADPAPDLPVQAVDFPVYLRLM
jgi:hypothetical protein